MYNPTSYKKKVRIQLTRNFALLRVVDKVNVVVQSYPSELEVQFLPGASVSLDFGMFT